MKTENQADTCYCWPRAPKWTTPSDFLFRKVLLAPRLGLLASTVIGFKESVLELLWHFADWNQRRGSSDNVLFIQWYTLPSSHPWAKVSTPHSYNSYVSKLILSQESCNFLHSSQLYSKESTDTPLQSTDRWMKSVSGKASQWNTLQGCPTELAQGLYAPLVPGLTNKDT